MRSPVAVPQFDVADAFVKMVEHGWLGQKAGIGFYRHRGKKKTANEAAPALLAGAATDDKDLLTSLPQAAQMREVRERMVQSMVLEAKACLTEGVAADAATIDLAMVLGTGWAPHRGGPLRYGQETTKSTT